MIDVLLDAEKYSKAELKIEITNLIKELSKDSILRFKMTYPENMHLLNAKFLDEILPWTMNYQFAWRETNRMRCYIIKLSLI